MVVAGMAIEAGKSGSEIFTFLSQNGFLLKDVSKNITG